ncbi:MAG TPA: Gfo/Idh/MocA family oxidoreductase, partial [Acidobacteriota bacterium]|nr:Gfo/Idh/MocA family oxidoreductase [Acidobacteriota bacterium]
MPDEKEITRRGFLESSGKLAAGALVAGTLPSRPSARTARRQAPAPAGRVTGANDRVNLGFVGVRGRGRDLYGYFGALPGVRVAALCDIDGNVLAERAADVEKRFGAKPAVFKDQRVLLESKDIDAVVVATPNHWHALSTIWACQAGKHVYVEKPCCHNLFEGRRMVEAARRYGRIVSVGCQNRSSRSV